MKVRDIMTANVVTVGPDVPYKDVVRSLVGAGVSALPVVDDDGQLLGIVTEADLVSKEAYPGHRSRALALLADVLAAREHHWLTKAAGLSARDVMTRNVAVCDADDDVSAVARRMLQRGVKRMPVVRDGTLIGIVSRPDILRLFVRADSDIAADVGHALELEPSLAQDGHVTFKVDDGIVTLRGDVRFEWDIAVAVALARAVPGVVDVVDVLHFREPNPVPMVAPTGY